MAGEEIADKGNAIVPVAAAVPVNAAPRTSNREAYDEEDRDAANPYLVHSEARQGRSSGAPAQSSNSSPYGTNSGAGGTRNFASPGVRNSRSGAGTDDGLDQPQSPRHDHKNLQDSSDSANYNDSSFMASSGTFGESSNTFDESFTPGESGALDEGGERKPKKKKKKHKHKHRSREDGHSSRHREKEPERPGLDPVYENARNFGPMGDD